MTANHLIMGASNAAEVGTNRDCRRIAGYRSMIAAVRTSAAVGRAVYRTDGDASVYCPLYLRHVIWAL